MTEEEKQELELLRREKQQRTQTERVCRTLEQAGIPTGFASFLVGTDDEDTDQRTAQFCSAYQTALADDVRSRLPQQSPAVISPAPQRPARGVRRIH